MNITTKVPPFYFKDIDKFIEELNKDFPIKLSNMEDIIEKVHLKYPLISKAEISLIIKNIFLSLRELLFRGYTMRFLGLIDIFRVNIYLKAQKSYLTKTVRNYINLRVQGNTPKNIKYSKKYE